MTPNKTQKDPNLFIMNLKWPKINFKKNKKLSEITKCIQNDKISQNASNFLQYYFKILSKITLNSSTINQNLSRIMKNVIN